MPKACIWKKQAHHKNISFDSISFDMVTWQPYEELYEIAEYFICQSCLISFNIVEYSMSDRVLQQFGKLQDIPVRPSKLDRREKVGLHSTNWTVESGKQIKDWKARERNVVKVVVDKSGGVPTAEYMAWYNMFLQGRKTPFRPSSQSQSNVQTAAG
ncbi:hypothetical protein AMTR_s00085p00128020 [Amborella trichopoda]|uniref:Aminotransferase-like plant mobile domain-containing protein n=2 Tax=Amborella trichopoda TaxID=13333 RepID=W1P6W6_AMBTC|nr:hypothetical protein AMTR_s00085p00128020 [Amborella trichopoda]